MAMRQRYETMACAAGLALVAATGVLLAPGELLGALIGLPALGMAARLLIVAALAVGVGVGFVALMHGLNRRQRARRRAGMTPQDSAFHPLPEPAEARAGTTALLARLEAGLARRGGRPPAVTAELADTIRRISRT